MQMMLMEKYLLEWMSNFYNKDMCKLLTKIPDRLCDDQFYINVNTVKVYVVCDSNALHKHNADNEESRNDIPSDGNSDGQRQSVQSPTDSGEIYFQARSDSEPLEGFQDAYSSDSSLDDFEAQEALEKQEQKIKVEMEWAKRRRQARQEKQGLKGHRHALNDDGMYRYRRFGHSSDDPTFGILSEQLKHDIRSHIKSSKKKRRKVIIDADSATILNILQFQIPIVRVTLARAPVSISPLLVDCYIESLHLIISKRMYSILIQISTSLLLTYYAFSQRIGSNPDGTGFGNNVNTQADSATARDGGGDGSTLRDIFSETFVPSKEKRKGPSSRDAVKFAASVASLLKISSDDANAQSVVIYIRDTVIRLISETIGFPVSSTESLDGYMIDSLVAIEFYESLLQALGTRQ